MFNWWNEFRNASGETKLFIYTVIVLAIIVLGSFIFAYIRLQSPKQRSLSQEEAATRPRVQWEGVS